jgi:hypothetical protein
VILTEIQWSMVLSEVHSLDGALCCGDEAGRQTISSSKRVRDELRELLYDTAGCHLRKSYEDAKRLKAPLLAQLAEDRINQYIENLAPHLEVRK